MGASFKGFWEGRGREGVSSGCLEDSQPTLQAGGRIPAWRCAPARIPGPDRDYRDRLPDLHGDPIGRADHPQRDHALQNGLGPPVGDAPGLSLIHISEPTRPY